MRHYPPRGPNPPFWKNESKHCISTVLFSKGASSSFYYPGEIDIVKGKRLTTLPFLDKEHYVGFEMIITKHTPGVWRNILHLTTGSNAGSYGSRIPAVFLFHDWRLTTVHAIDGNPNAVWFDPFHVSRQPGVWVKLEFEQLCEWGQVRICCVLGRNFL